MTDEEIIEMAEKSGCYIRNGHIYNQYVGSLDQVLKRFAKLVAEKEREECAKLCDLTMLQNQEAINELEDDEHIAKCFIQGAMTQLVKTSKAIRAKGQE